MTINLHKLQIKLEGPHTSNTKILTETGEEIAGISEISIRLRANDFADLTLEVRGIQGLDLSQLTANLEIDDQTLVRELLSRGYKVSLDDSDIEDELRQGDEHQDPGTQLSSDL